MLKYKLEMKLQKGKYICKGRCFPGSSLSYKWEQFTNIFKLREEE